MKKLSLSVLGFLFFISATILFMNCDNNNDENDGPGKEDKKHYLTISYHSEGHTEGEVPVDDTRYEIEATGHVYEIDFAYPYKVTIPIKDHNLKKNGCFFNGWIIKDSETSTVINENVSADARGALLVFLENKNYHCELHAIWESL